jgi:hypothetical protein
MLALAAREVISDLVLGIGNPGGIIDTQWRERGLAFLVLFFCSSHFEDAGGRGLCHLEGIYWRGGACATSLLFALWL